MRAYIALGSNLGDREEFLRQAVDAIPDRVDQSSVYETDPVGGPGGQGAFLNMVVALETTKTPRELLEMCQSLERAAGRVREEHWGPRTLDADVLFVGDLVVNEPDLVVPHPLALERAFVVEPLREIATGAVAAMLPNDLDTSGVRRAPSLWGDFDTSLRPADVAGWMEGWPGPWAVAGGWAIELFVGQSWRAHGDVEISIARADSGQLHAQFPGWEFFIPAPGGFTPWPVGSSDPFPARQFWARPSPDAPWSLEVFLESIDADVLAYKKDATIQLPLDRVVHRTTDGVPFIAPELQLLHKARGARQRDEVDFAMAAPLLDADARGWLITALERTLPNHPWLAALRSG